MQNACAALLSTRMWSATKEIVDAAAATCPLPPAPALQDCSNFGELHLLIEPVNTACCTAIVDCSSGMPSTCSDTCASVLLPFRDSCARFLSQPMLLGMKQIVDEVADSCAVDQGTASVSPPPSPCFPNPCANGGWCRERVADGRDFLCTCPAGFSGADCTRGEAEQPWCQIELPSVPETLQNWMDTGNWKTSFVILNFYLEQLSILEWCVPVLVVLPCSACPIGAPRGMETSHSAIAH